MSAKRISDRIASLLFPDCCVFCGCVMTYVKSRICICPACAEKLIFSDEVVTCSLCGRHLTTGERLCPTCQSHRHFFNRAVSCLAYELGTRQSILRYKFGGRTDYAATYAAMMARRIQPLCQKTRFDFVVCAPLSKKTLQERGYNQAELIAKELSRYLKVPCIPTLKRTNDGEPQHTLSAALRRENVKKCYFKTDRIGKGKILLVDDIYTTGATANYCSRLLREMGYEKVYLAIALIREAE